MSDEDGDEDIATGWIYHKCIYECNLAPSPTYRPSWCAMQCDKVRDRKTDTHSGNSLKNDMRYVEWHGFVYGSGEFIIWRTRMSILAPASHSTSLPCRSDQVIKTLRQPFTVTVINIFMKIGRRRVGKEWSEPRKGKENNKSDHKNTKITICVRRA